jgi:hypothetical protein
VTERHVLKRTDLLIVQLSATQIARLSK